MGVDPPRGAGPARVGRVGRAARRPARTRSGRESASSSEPLALGEVRGPGDPVDHDRAAGSAGPSSGSRRRVSSIDSSGAMPVPVAT